MSIVALPSRRSSATRAQILDAAAIVLARRGPQKLSVTDIAVGAGVSRQTLYKYFPSKDALLVAFALQEKQRFVGGMATALDGLVGASRLDAALEYIVRFQSEHPLRGLVSVEPGFVLQQLEQHLDTMRGPLFPLLDELADARHSPDDTGDVADLIVRTALSHFLVPGDDVGFLRQLRRIAGISAAGIPRA